MVAIKHGMVMQRNAVLLLLLLCFVSLSNKGLGGPGNAKVCSFHCCTNALKKKLNKNLAASFTSTLSLVLLTNVFIIA